MQKLWFGPSNHRNRNSQAKRVFWATWGINSFWLQNHCSTHKFSKNKFFGAFWPFWAKLLKIFFFGCFDPFWARLMKFMLFCRFWPAVGKICENSVVLCVLTAKPLFWAKYLKNPVFLCVLAAKPLFRPNFWRFCFCAFWLQNLAKIKMSGKQRENNGKTAGKQRELGPNSGKTAGKGAQTAGIWKILEKSVFGHKSPKNRQISTFQHFFANFGCNSWFETWFRCFAMFCHPIRPKLVLFGLFAHFGLCFASDTFGYV